MLETFSADLGSPIKEISSQYYTKYCMWHLIISLSLTKFKGVLLILIDYYFLNNIYSVLWMEIHIKLLRIISSIYSKKSSIARPIFKKRDKNKILHGFCLDIPFYYVCHKMVYCNNIRMATWALIHPLIIICKLTIKIFWLVDQFWDYY